MVYVKYLVFILFVALTCSAYAESLWDNQTVPGRVDSGEGRRVELGVKFKATTDGVVHGVKFYKSRANTGRHYGKLWKRDGSLLASKRFRDESSSGWQTVLFDNPIPITKDTVYVASYHTRNGHYSFDKGYFTIAYHNGANLVAPTSGDVGGNGVYRYGWGGFPNNTFNAANYWVDVIFEPAPTPEPEPEPEPEPVVGSISLEWDQNPEPEVGGYRVHYGEQSGSYNEYIDVGGSTYTEITDLPENSTYYFAVTAYPALVYSDIFAESDYSSEVSATISSDPDVIDPPQGVNILCAP